jgi:hypothetical protein
MRCLGLFIIYGLLFSLPSQAQDSVYMFSYFKGNGEDGLHFASSTDGFAWQTVKNDASFLKPLLSKDKLMRDPCIIRGADGLFHMVWTVSWNDRGIGYASTPDLVNWSEQQYIPVMAHEDSALNCWAPEITYDPKKKQYMIYWATTIVNRFKKGADSGDGKYNHRMYIATTKDFKTYSKTKLWYDKGFNVIDATIFSAPGGYAMILKDETRYPPQKNLQVAFSKKLSKGWSAPSPSITGKEWAEGPTVAKIGNEWVVYYDKYRDKKYGAVASSDLKIWRDISDKISFPAGTRHGTVFKVSREEFARVRE